MVDDVKPCGSAFRERSDHAVDLVEDTHNSITNNVISASIT